MNASQTENRIERRNSVIPHSAISREAGPVPVGANRRADDVKLDFTTENGVIQSIRITCSCGREIHLECQY